MPDPGIPTFPRILTESGYQTCAIGKMHYFPVRNHHGFAHMELMEELPESREDDAYLQFLKAEGHGDRRAPHGVRPLFYRSPQRWDLPEKAHGTAWVADRTTDFIRQKRKKPWMCFSSWIAPHPPLALPERWLDLYRDAKLPEAYPDPGNMTNVAPSPYRVDKKKERRMREAYYGAISMVDHYIGNILQALEDTGQRENTCILFTSDHGEMLGDRGCWSKHIPYEGSVRIPMIATGPGFPPGTQSTTAVSSWDVTETILAISDNCREGNDLPGKDLRELANSAPKRIAFTHYEEGNKRYVVAVSGPLKYIYWYNGGREELYHLDEDPNELQNLAGTESPHPELVHLREAVIRFEQTHGWNNGVNDESLAVFPDSGPLPYETSLYPAWSSFQFPDWEPGEMDEKSRALFMEEMQACTQQDGAHVTGDPELREQAIAYWCQQGGLRSEYDRIFNAMNKRSHP